MCEWRTHVNGPRTDLKEGDIDVIVFNDREYEYDIGTVIR